MKVRILTAASSLPAVLGISCVLGLIVGCSGADETRESGSSGDEFAFVTSELQRITDDAGIDDASLLLIQGGEVVYDEEVGTPPDRPVPIASSTKWLSAAAVMSLADDGLLSLDDSVSSFLPSFEGEKAEITIRQLLSHTSGLPAHHPCLKDRRTTLEACVVKISQVDLEAR